MSDSKVKKILDNELNHLEDIMAQNPSCNSFNFYLQDWHIRFSTSPKKFNDKDNVISYIKDYFLNKGYDVKVECRCLSGALVYGKKHTTGIDGFTFLIKPPKKEE